MQKGIVVRKGAFGSMLIDSVLPEQMRGKARTLDAKGLATLFKEVHEAAPEKYPTVLKNLADIGRRVSTESGGFSFGPEDLIEPEHITKLKDVVRQKVHHEILRNRQDSALGILRELSGTLPKDLYAHQLSIGSPMAKQIASGSRGNPGAMARLMSGDVLYVDHRDREVPYPILRGFAEGLDSAEYFGASFGGRKGVVDTKLSVQNSGALAKVLKQAVHKLLVTKQQDDFEENPDRPRGLPVDTEDNESDGAFLAQPVAGFPRNTVINSKVRAAIKAKGFDRILVRSPISGRIAPGGGLYARDVGIRESGDLPGIGDAVGITASDTISEPVGQGTLCLAIGTLIRMADWTVKAIELIEPGEWVMGADKDNNLFPVQVLNRFNNGLKLCHRTNFNVGCTKEVISLESTLDHKVSGTARYWDSKTELAVPGVFPIGHKCVKFSAAMANSVTNSAGREEPFALLFGLLLGDGCYTESVHSVNLSCHDPLLITDINPKLEGLNLRANKLKGHKGYYKIAMIEDETRSTDSATGRFVPVGGAVNPIKKELIRRGMHGKYAHEKVIPEDVWGWNSKSVSDLIGGFFATDGSVYGTSADGDFFKNVYVSFGSTSLTMLETLRQLLAVRYGIYATIPNRQSKGRKRPFWTMSVSRRNEVIKFYESIPLYGVKKKTFETLLSKWKPLQIKNYSFFYRKKQESIGLLETFDIEVDHPDHLFQLANGLIVSNSSKHAGGAAGSVRKIGGFKALQQIIGVPKTFPGGAAHSETDGNVDSITDHPDGGKVVSISGTEHYVSPGFAINVKPGDTVEAGDPISDGLPNPAKIAEHQGLGEAKRKMVGYLKNTLADLNISAERRNLELVAHGLVNHVTVDDELGPYYPGDTVPYDEIEKYWQPRDTARASDVDDAAGQYLEEPVLHYTVGTKIRPSVRKELKAFGVKNVKVHPEPPPFHASMIRAQDSLRHDPDWMTRFLGTNLEDSLLDSTHRGLSSSPASTSFVPAAASGQIENFGPIAGKGILKAKPGSVLNGVGGFGKAANDIVSLPAIKIDRPKGFQKKFRTPAGEVVSTYPVDYGYFDGVINPDDQDGADVFLGSGGDTGLHGRFMKGKTLGGKWEPDERKWYANLTPEEHQAVLNFYTDQDPTLLRDHAPFNSISQLVEDLKSLSSANKTAEEEHKHGQHYCSSCGTMVWQCRCITRPGQTRKQYHDVDPSRCRNCNPEKQAAGLTAAGGTGGPVAAGPLTTKPNSILPPPVPKPKPPVAEPKPVPQPKAMSGITEGNSATKPLPGVASNPAISNTVDTVGKKGPPPQVAMDTAPNASMEDIFSGKIQGASPIAHAAGGQPTPPPAHTVSPLTSAAVSALGRPVAQYGGLAGLAALTDFTGHNGSNIQTLFGDRAANPDAHLFERALPAHLRNAVEPLMDSPRPAAPPPQAVAAPAPAAPAPVAPAAPAPAAPAAPAVPAAPTTPAPPPIGNTGQVTGAVAGQVAAPSAASAVAKKAPKFFPQWAAKGIGGLGAMAGLPAVGDAAQQLYEHGRIVDWNRIKDITNSSVGNAATFGLANQGLRTAINLGMRNAVPKPGVKPGPGFIPTMLAQSFITDMADRAGILPKSWGGSANTNERLQKHIDAGNVYGQMIDNDDKSLKGLGKATFGLLGGLTMVGSPSTYEAIAKDNAALNQHLRTSVRNNMTSNQGGGYVTVTNPDGSTRVVKGKTPEQAIEAAKANKNPAHEMRVRLSAAAMDARKSHGTMMASAPEWSRMSAKSDLWGQLGDQMEDLARARVMLEHGMKEDGTTMSEVDKTNMRNAIKQRSAMVQRNQDLLNRGFWGDAFAG